MENVSLLQYCVRHDKKDLIWQWDIPENKDFDPEKTGFASHKKIWWTCEKGHKWQAMVSDRVKKDAGCPFCTNRKAWPGYNDLASTYPELAAQWHPEKNGTLTPEMVTCGSVKNVWWQCELGHEWKATVGNRATKGNECPYCSGKKAWPGFNDLVTMEPELMKEWHPLFNQGIDPTKLRPNSRQRIWWRCSEGHEWEAHLFNRTAYGSGCPFCAGNLSKEKAAEWRARAAKKREEISFLGSNTKRTVNLPYMSNAPTMPNIPKVQNTEITGTGLAVP